MVPQIKNKYRIIQQFNNVCNIITTFLRQAHKCKSLIQDRSLATNVITIRININIYTFVNTQAKEMINMHCSFLGYEIM